MASNSTISYIFEKTLVLSIIRNMCKSEDEKIFEEKESIAGIKTYRSITKKKKKKHDKIVLLAKF